MSTREFTYLSFGAGVQSSALLVMSALGLNGCPKADIAIFADTGDEPAWVYDHLIVMSEWGAANGLPVLITSAGCLSDDTLARLSGAKSRAAQIPAFTTNEKGKASMLMRQCTSDYKLDPLTAAVRSYLGYKRNTWMRHSVTALIGISTDEADRMKPPRAKWLTNVYPLINADMSRADCLDMITALELPEPRRSACIYCPFHSNDYWRGLSVNAPEEFARAVAFDEAIRDQRSIGIERPVFLHRSLIPLKELPFTSTTDADNRNGFSNECEGMCGV